MRLSVIIPACNEADYIKNAVQSIKNAEIIVVANGCDDDTADIARRAGARVIETKKQNKAYACNLGAEHAKGDMYVFLDADSTLEKGAFDIIKKYACGKVKVQPANRNIKSSLYYWMADIFGVLLSPFTFTDFGAGACVFIKKELFENIESVYGEGFNTALDVLEDLDFIKRMKKHGDYTYVRDTCIYTSMRRYEEKGYVKCMLQDFAYSFNAEKHTR